MSYPSDEQFTIRIVTWSPAGKGLTSWLLLVMFILFFLTVPCGILGQMWYLIVSFPDLCRLSYFISKTVLEFKTKIDNIRNNSRYDLSEVYSFQ